MNSPSIRTLSAALISLSLPLVVAGAAVAQTIEVEDEDLLTPRERALARHPGLQPEWTWMSENQATALLKAAGYSVVLSLEKHGAFWRGKAINGGASYHVAINRYAEIVSHIDRKSLIAATERQEGATPVVKTMLATLNGPVELPKSQTAPTGLTRRPVATVMGEVGWTWLSEDQATRILKSKGYANIGSLQRDPEGIWRAKAINSDRAPVRVALDVYGNVEAQPESTGGVAQGDPSDLTHQR
jgi:hypothetical protein